MKKIASLLMCVFLFSCVYSQDSTKQKKKINQTLYVSLGQSVSITGDLTTGFQLGSWGTNDNPICYVLAVDYGYNLKYKTSNVFIGVVPSYYFLNLKKSGMFAYVSPKFQVFNSDLKLNKQFVYLFEYGVGGYYTINPHIIFQYGVGIQSISTEFDGGKPFIPSLSVSINYIK